MLPKDQLPTAWQFNMNTYASQAISKKVQVKMNAIQGKEGQNVTESQEIKVAKDQKKGHHNMDLNTCWEKTQNRLF